MSQYLDRTVPVREILSGELLKKVQQVFQANSASAGFGIVVEYLKPKWREYRSEKSPTLSSISDWALSVFASVPEAGLGRSLRQIERRIKNLTGQSQRELEFFRRNEKSFEIAVKAMRDGKVNAADVAIRSGFSDQSHLGRNVKRQTGHSPKNLLWHIENDEAYWSYRLIAGLK